MGVKSLRLFIRQIVDPAVAGRTKWQWLDYKTATTPAAGVEHAAANRRRGPHRENVGWLRSQCHNITFSASRFNPTGCGAPSPEATAGLKNCGVDLMITLSYSSVF